MNTSLARVLMGKDVQVIQGDYLDNWVTITGAYMDLLRCNG